MKIINYEDLVGNHVFSGVDYIPSVLGPDDNWTEYGNSVVFCLDGNNYVMTEDNEDGYRSHMTALTTTNRKIINRFAGQPVQVLHLKKFDDYEEKCDIIRIQTYDGKIIMEVGTSNTDDWYPYTVFHYHPENMDINQ